MKSYLYLLIIVLITQACSQTKHTQTNSSSSELVTVVKATEQRWAGGIAGRMGTNYSITFETKPDVIADTVWIESHYFPLVDPKTLPMDQAPINWKVEYNPDKWIYNVNVGIDRSEYNRYTDSDRDAYQETNIGHQPDTSGVVYISYTYKGTRDGKTVTSFEKLPTLNYP